MITNEEYRESPAALHQAYYLEVARDANIVAPPAHSNLDRIRETALAYRAELTVALSRRGSPWDLTYGVCAVGALIDEVREA